MRDARLLALPLALALVAGAAHAQDASTHASVRTSDGTRWVNVDVEVAADGTRLVGCVSSGRSCRRTVAVALTASELAELAAREAAVAAMPRCEPSAFAPGDPAFHLAAGRYAGEGHVPAAWGVSPARAGSGGEPPGWSEACRADARLAHFLASTWARTGT